MNGSLRANGNKTKDVDTIDRMTTAYAICYGTRYLRKVGNSDSRGIEWADTISEARMYASPEQLDRHLLQVARECPNGGPWPFVVEIEVKIVSAIVTDERFRKNRERALKAETTRQTNWNKIVQRNARQEIDRLEDQLRRAREQAGL